MELLHRFPEVLHSPLVPVITPSQIELISFWVTGIAFLQLLLFFTTKLRAQPLRYLPRDLLLHGERVGNFAVVLLAPKLLVVAHVNQSGANGQVVAALQNSARQDRTHAQILARRKRLDLFCLVTSDRRAGDHSQIRKLREAVDDAFGQTIGKILGFGIVILVSKRQDGDRVDCHFSIARVQISSQSNT